MFLDEHENGAGSVGGHFKMVTALEMRPRLGLDSRGRLSLRNLLDGRGTRPHTKLGAPWRGDGGHDFL